MASSYKKKGRPYSKEDISSAIKEVKDGASLRQVALKYKMDKMFLHRRVHGTHSGVQGRKTDLTADQETTLSNHLKTLAKWGFPITRSELLLVVQGFVGQNGLTTRFKDGKPGSKWFRHFLVSCYDPFIIYDFYDKLEAILEELDIKDKPANIWNLDETFFSADPSRVQAVGGIGQKFSWDIQGSVKDNTTVLACVSAEGRALPPLIIFEGVHLRSSWKGARDLSGTFYSTAVNGFMTSLSYFSHFRDIVKESPLLQLLDSHLSHLDLTVIEKARNKRIAVMKLPPHTTDQLQPLDKCCFKPFNHRNQNLWILCVNSESSASFENLLLQRKVITSEEYSKLIAEKEKPPNNKG
ncbi:uncharacterized protein LOC126172509 [Schistocerca cancellata]|uniref:uncharacterized protein LOC126172509 n=1 Tax=Schistocerca cancellata TaxID=274614 RepID=UPI0021187B96|nr:uncharacterized protein LOC126172509 [Schistocerca cancellata]